jgi:hypothetical protein
LRTTPSSLLVTGRRKRRMSGVSWAVSLEEGERDPWDASPRPATSAPLGSARALARGTARPSHLCERVRLTQFIATRESHKLTRRAQGGTHPRWSGRHTQRLQYVSRYGTPDAGVSRRPPLRQQRGHFLPVAGATALLRLLVLPRRYALHQRRQAQRLRRGADRRRAGAAAACTAKERRRRCRGHPSSAPPPARATRRRQRRRRGCRGWRHQRARARNRPAKGAGLRLGASTPSTQTHAAFMSDGYSTTSQHQLNMCLRGLPLLGCARSSTCCPNSLSSGSANALKRDA